jgi:hypothetical protein
MPVLSGRREWLSITPEPERELPPAIATLRAGGTPSAEAVERERARAEQLVLYGSRRRWLAYLAEAERLAERTEVESDSDDGELAWARQSALAVIRNHDALMLGLPGAPWVRRGGARRESRR